MTKRWGPNLRSEMTKTKRSAAKKERAKAQRRLRREKQDAAPMHDGHLLASMYYSAFGVLN